MSLKVISRFKKIHMIMLKLGKNGKVRFGKALFALPSSISIELIEHILEKKERHVGTTLYKEAHF